MNLIEFSAEDFRQFVYCPRIIFFRYVAKIKPRRTFKMAKGGDYHQEKIRRRTQSVNENIIINYNVFLKEPELGLFALFDAVAKEEPENYFPIEFKTGKVHKNIPEHHQAQLITQAIILEGTFGVEVHKAEIRYGGEKRIQIIITLEDKIRILKCQSEMLMIVTKESIPPPTNDKQKCRDCELWIQCQRA